MTGVSGHLIVHNNLLLNKLQRKGLHALLMGGLNNFINYNLEFINLKGLHILAVEGLNTIREILEYIDVCGGGAASRPDYRRAKYFH